MFSRGQPRYYAQEQALLPPLGLLSIAAYLLEHTRHEVRVVDMPADGMRQEGLRRLLRAQRPEVVGVTCLTHTLWDALETARTVKAELPGVPVVFGGHHTQLYPDESLAQPGVDAIVLGAGEVAFAELVSRYASDGRLPRIPGVLRKGDATGDGASEVQALADPDALPFPARALTPYRAYYSATSVAPPTTVLMTSYGCPFRCVFCNTSGVSRVLARDPERVVEELDQCAGLGIREFSILDENFAVDRRRVLAIAEGIVSRGLDVRWSCRARVDLVDRDLLAAMRRAGCTSVHFGVESGDPDVLAATRKGIDLGQVRRAFREARDAGVETTAAFMIGFPGEREEQVERTIRLAIELDPSYVQFAVLIPLPGTELYEQAFERGLFDRDHWREFARSPVPDFEPPAWEETFTRAQLDALVDRAYRRFYLRPGYVARRLARVRDLSHLGRQARVALRMLLRQ